jgi:hypothetical protein
MRHEHRTVFEQVEMKKTEKGKEISQRGSPQ